MERKYRLYNCMTRLRIRQVIEVKMDELKSTEGVLGVVEQDTLQVSLALEGSKAGDIFAQQFIPQGSQDCRI